MLGGGPAYPSKIRKIPTKENNESTPATWYPGNPPKRDLCTGWNGSLNMQKWAKLKPFYNTTYHGMCVMCIVYISDIFPLFVLLFLFWVYYCLSFRELKECSCCFLLFVGHRPCKCSGTTYSHGFRPEIIEPLCKYENEHIYNPKRLEQKQENSEIIRNNNKDNDNNDNNDIIHNIHNIHNHTSNIRETCDDYHIYYEHYWFCYNNIQKNSWIKKMTPNKFIKSQDTKLERGTHSYSQ